MVADIEGIANLYRISAFMNRDLLPKTLDISKVEEFKILNEPSGIEVVTPEIYYNKALSIISEFGGSPEPLQIFEKEEKREKPEKKVEFKEKNILPEFFDKTPKKKTKEVIPSSDYEKSKFNKLIYGFKPEEDDSERLTMLESISSLREELNRMDIKTGTIPQVDDTSTMFDIKNVYKM